MAKQLKKYMIFQHNKKSLIFFKLIFLVLLTVYLINTNFLDFNKLLQYHVDIKILFIIFILVSVSIIAATLRWALLLKMMNFKIEIKKVLEITYISCFFNSILLGGLGGEFFRAYCIYNSSKDNNLKLSISVLVDRVIGFSGLFLIILYFSKNIVQYELSIFINNIFFIFLFTLAFFSIFFYIMKKKSSIYKTLIKIELFRFIKKNILKLISTVILSIILFMAVNFCMYIIVVNIYKFNLDLDTVCLSNSISIIFNTLSFTPGGFGVGEIVFAKILEYLNNQDLTGIVSVYIFWRLIYLIFCLPAFILFLFYKTKIYSFEKN